MAAGAIEKSTAREIGAASEVVFTSLPGPAEFTDVTVEGRRLVLPPSTCGFVIAE